MQALAQSGGFLFEDFRLDRGGGGLFRCDDAGTFVPVAVGSRGLDILGVLISRAGEVVSKDEIVSAVWPGSVVEDSNLTVQISALRRVLDRDRTQGSCIRTVAGRGYRFVAPMTRVDANSCAVRRSQNDARSAPRLSIVVLPFANLSNDPEQEYFVDAITDDLTTDLSRISGSFVIARSTAFTYKNKPIDVGQVGRERGIRYVLEGSVRRSGDQIRVNVQLVDAESGAHLWADRFDTNWANFAEAQNEITGRIARTLNFALVDDVGQRIERERAADLNACDLIMRGRALFNRPHSATSLQYAQESYEQVLEKNSKSIDAKICIASVLLAKIANAWSSSAKQDTARAEQLLLEALEHNANSAWARATMGLLRRLQDRLIESRIELETAITLDPNNVRAFRQLGYTLMQLGKPDAAIPLIEKGIRLSPFNSGTPGAYQVLGLCHLLLGDIEQAIIYSRKSLAENPRLYYTYTHLAAEFALKGDLAQARAALTEGIRLKPELCSVTRVCASLPYSHPE
jgi:adenylate cyclase